MLLKQHNAEAYKCILCAVPHTYFPQFFFVFVLFFLVFDIAIADVWRINFIVSLGKCPLRVKDVCFNVFIFCTFCSIFMLLKHIAETLLGFGYSFMPYTIS